MKDYHYIIYVNKVKYKVVFTHQALIECIEQIRVERGVGSKYEIILLKV